MSSEFKNVEMLLSEPFDVEMAAVRKGAAKKDKSAAIALIYVDKRVYEERLDQVLGLEGWEVRYEAWGDSKIICILTIKGVTKSDCGESEKDQNSGTIAVAQAFKRACSTFGLGRYLYFLPTVWCELNERGYFIRSDKEIAEEVYSRAGLSVVKSDSPAVATTMADLITPKQLAAIRAICSSRGMTDEQVLRNPVLRLEELTRKAASEMIRALESV